MVTPQPRTHVVALDTNAAAVSLKQNTVTPATTTLELGRIQSQPTIFIQQNAAPLQKSVQEKPKNKQKQQSSHQRPSPPQHVTTNFVPFSTGACKTEDAMSTVMYRNIPTKNHNTTV